MQTFCITLPETPGRWEAARKHFTDMSVEGVQWMQGIHAEGFGLLCSKPYTVDNQYQGYLIPLSQVGLFLSHYMAWSICSFLPDEKFLILEDDAEFPADWKERMEAALKNAPPDTDMLMVGNSNCSDKPQTKIADEIFEVKYPMATHAYVVWKKALPTLLGSMRSCTKIDIGLMFNAYPKLKVYSVLPRIIHQRGTPLFP